MRKSPLLTLGLVLLLWAGAAQARQSFVSEELESDATRLEQNIGQDLDAFATRPLPQLYRVESRVNGIPLRPAPR